MGGMQEELHEKNDSQSESHAIGMWTPDFLIRKMANELRWSKARDHVHNFYCTKKYNDYGRYISVVAV